MKKGYQLLEVKSLDNLAKWPQHHVLLIAILRWLIDEIDLESNEKLKNAQIEVIYAQYVGDGYPTLGIHYFNAKNPVDVGPIVEAAIERLLKEKIVNNFVEFAGKGGTNWSDILNKIKKEGQYPPPTNP